MDEIKRAQNIIQAYAEDIEGLTVEECATEGFSTGQCEVLVQALGKGAEGKITATDAFVLQSRHFSKEFIDALAGADGNKALQQRGAWFAYNWHVARVNIEDAMPALITALGNGNEYVRRQVAKTLENINDVRAVPVLIAALGDGDASVRLEAIRALGKIKDERVVPALIAALGHGDANVRYGAIWALGEIKDARAVPELIELIKNDKHPGVRKGIALALGNIGHVAAIPLLLDMVRNDPDPVCREAAEEALEKLRGN